MIDECELTVATDTRGRTAVLKVRDAGGQYRFECVLEPGAADELAALLGDAARHITTGAGGDLGAKSVNAGECGVGVRVDGGVVHVFVVDLKNARAAASLPVSVDQARRAATALVKAASESKAQPRG